MLLEDILSQLVNARRERKQDCVRVQACTSLTAGPAKGSDVLVSLQGVLIGLLSYLFNMPTSMALSKLVWQRNTDLNPHKAMQLALEAGMLNLSFEV